MARTESLDSLVAARAGRPGSGPEELAQGDCVRCLGDDLGWEWRAVEGSDSHAVNMPVDTDRNGPPATLLALFR